jgi:hypothetical protein
VVVPPASARDRATINLDEQMIKNALMQALDEKEKNKRELGPMSEITSGKRAKLITKLKLPVVIIEVKEPEVKENSKDHIPSFEWRQINEEDQIDQYREYLNLHLLNMLQQHGLCLAFVENNHHLLDVVDSRLPFDISGGTDVLILKDLGKLTSQHVHHLQGLRMVIELKKDLNERFVKKESQALAELVAVNIKAPDRSAVVLLTDLGHQWHFMWLSSDHTIKKVVLQHPKNAIAFIGAIVARNDLSIRIPFSGVGRLPGRGNIDEMIPSTEGDNIGELVNRYRSIADILCPDMSMEREIGWRVVKEMPAYSSMYA